MNQSFPLFHWYTNRSFRVQLLSLVTPFMVGTLLIIGFIGVRVLQNDRQAVDERLNQEVGDLTDRISEPFLSLYDNIQFLKAETAIIDYATIYNSPVIRLEEEQQRQADLARALPHITTDLQGFMQGRSLYSQIRLLDTEGIELVKVSQVRGTAQFSTDLQDVHRENAFVEGLTLRFSSQIWASEVRYREDADGIQRPLMEIVTPIADTLNSENIAGYLVVELNLESVFGYLREQDIDKGFAYLVDADGYYLGHSLNSQRGLLFGRDTDQGGQLTGKLAEDILTYTPAENVQLSQDDTDYLAYTAIIEPLRDFADTPNAPIWTIVVAEPSSDVTSQTRLLVLTLLVVFAVLVAMTIVWVWTESDQFASRLEVVYNELKRVYLGDLSAHLPDKWGNNEFTQISTGFNQMTERLSGLVNELETRVEARIRDLDLVAEITREVAGLQNLDLILNRAINRIIERFEFYHAQVFLVDEAKDYAVLVASTGDPGQRLLAKRHKLAVGSESVIGRVSALGITVIAGDTQSSEVPWQPNVELPDTRSEMALPLKVEQRVIGALDIQSKQPEAFGQSDIEIFQVLADQLAIAINNARLIGQLQSRVDEVNRLNQQMVEKVWIEFAQNEPQIEPFAYRYNLINIETVPSNGQETTIEGSFSAAIEIGGNQIGEINTAITEELTSEKVALIQAIANRVALAIDNARLVQETQGALAEAQRLYEMARTVNSVAELDIQGIYNPIIDQLVFEPHLEQVAILLAAPIPSYLASHLEVVHMWQRHVTTHGWSEGDQLNLLQQGLVERLEVAPRSPIVVQNRATLQSVDAPPALHAIMDTLGAETVLLVPMMTGSRWFGLMVCASSQPNAFSENFINFAGAVADQMTIAVDNRRLFNEVQDEARRALALAEAGQLVSQISGDLESGLSRLFRVISGPAEFDRWWFGLVETGGQRLRQVAAATPTTAFPQTIDLTADHNTLTESVLLRQVMLVNEFDQEHPILGKISPEYRLTYGKHLAVPVMVGDDLLGVLLLGRAPTLRDFDERDVQFASTLASQLAVATENQRLFSRIEAQSQTLQSTIEAMPAGILVLDVDGKVLLYNEQVLEMLGRGVKQGVYQPNTYTIRYVGTDELVDLEEFPTTQAIKTKSRISTEGLYVDLPDGSRLDLLINAAPIFGEDGQLTSIVSIYQEITELRELELALQASLSETTALYEASRSVAAATSPDELMAAIVDQVQSLVPDKIFIMFREGQEEGDMRTRVAGVWPSTGELPTMEEIGISDELLMTDSVVILNDAPVLHGTGLRSFASLPLKARGERILGWFSVGYLDKHEFSSEEKRYLATLADQAAVGLDVIRLFESTRSALRSVANLYRGSKHISDAQGIADAVEVVREELMHFAPDRIDLLIQQNPEDTDLLYAALTWKSEESLVNVPALPVDPATLEPQADFHLMSREEFYIQDMGGAIDNELQQALRDLDTPYQALLSIPLRVSGRTVGRLAMGFLKPHKFTPDDHQFVAMLADSVAYIVENELLFQQTQDSLEETGVLYQASRAIANAETREDVVQAMIDYAASAVVDKVMLITLLTESWDDHNAIIEVTATWGRGEFLDLKGLRFSRDQLPIWDQLASPEIVSSDNIEADPHIDDNSRLGCRTLDVASFVVVPLQAQGRAIGSVMLASSEPRVHAEREIRIYQALADQAAVQLENKRLFEQTEFRTRQLSASAEVARDATSILNLDELFPRIVNLIRDAFGYDHAQIFMLDEENERAVLRAATGEAGRQLLSIGHNLKVGSHSVVGRTCLNAEPFMVNDTSEADVVHRPNPYLPETRAELAIPLIVKGQVRGAIDVQSNQPRAFSNEDVQILTTLADQIAVAIDNAQLFEISQQRAADMTLLFDVTSTAAAATSLAETLETVTTLLVRQLRGQEAAMFIYDATDNALHSQVVVIAEQTGQGVEYRFLDDVNFVIPYGSGIVGSIAQSHQPYIVNDFEQEPRYLGSQTKTRSGIYVPLISGSNVLGVMAIEGGRPSQFNEDDMRLLQTLSTSLTAIIKNLQLLDELQLAIDRLREVDQLKTNFLAAMSHELRTPLNSIIGFSRVILKGIDGPITDMQRQDIQTIHDSGKHLLGLVNDILDQAKIEAGKMELVREYFDVKAIVKGVMATAIGFTKEKPVQLYTNVEDDLPQGFGDEFRTRQIILNLVSNAAKFTSEGNVTTNVYATVDEETGQRFITISVADTGIGIAKENIARIFESFQQVDNTTTRTVEGTGLGLPLARSLAELQGGSIWVESAPGMGSTFFVTIPTSPQATDTLELEAAAVEEEAVDVAPVEIDPNDTKPLQQRRTVLAVDDELGMIDLYRRYLAKEGWQVIGVTNPDQTEEMVALHSPQLILLDINMPQRTGWDVLEHLKQSKEAREIPVIVCSIETDVSRSTALGAVSHLVKPFVETDLLKVVHEIT
ncbi:MAG: GAF domain-containing protein [Anaerolineales bacterium]|nr:GAF domain-containing protein [Anaerolineales bacterium]